MHRVSLGNTLMAYLPPNTFAQVSKTTGYTVVVSDYFVKGDTTTTAFTVTLFTATGNSGKELVIKNLGTKNLTISGSGSEAIDGVTTKILTNKYASINILCDGTGWNIF